MKADYYGILHCITHCYDCDWHEEDYRNLRKLRREINKHIKETGHTVAMEKGVVIVYHPDEWGGESE